MLAVLGLPASAQAAEPDFHRCRDAAAGARCGYVRVPLDRLAPAGEKIRIGFELYRRRDRGRPALGTIVDVEGGPGYSTTDSRDYFLELGRPLMGRRDLLLVDARGTGLSGPLDCPALRRTVADYIRRAGPLRRPARAARRPLHHARVRRRPRRRARRARIAAVDLYGDSYGSYFGQAFAVNHPDRLRSLVLDGTYPLPGTDPAFGDLAEATWRALRLVCERRPSCAARGEDPLAVLQRFVERDPRAPGARASASTPRATRIRVLLDIAGARHDRPVGLRQPADVPRPVRRDPRVRGRRPRADAAARGRDEARPRRVARALVLGGALPRGRRATTTRRCGTRRRRSRPAGSSSRRLRAALPPAQFAPFTGTEWTSLPYEGATACLRWPGPSRPEPPVDPQAPYPAVPTLVVNGDLDNITATSGARVVASTVPELDLRRDAQHDPRLRARRPRRLRRADRPPLHPHA